jgi:ABC-type phosphate transport system substrate-binding protein
MLNLPCFVDPAPPSLAPAPLSSVSTETYYNNIQSVGRTVAHFPFVMGSVAVFFNGGEGNVLPNTIQLDACTLGRIFSGQITNWNHADIAERNPTLTLPDLPITVIHRLLGSSSTAGITQYLDKATTQDGCPESWTLGSGSTITWFSGAVSADGSSGVTEAIKATVGAIGYLDAGHGYSASLAEVALRNEDGVYLLANNAEVAAAGAVAVANGEIPTNATDSFASVDLYNLSGPTTWPITLISYLYVDVDANALGDQAGTYRDNLPLLVALLEYINSDEGQALAEEEEFGFAGVPQELRDLNAATIELIKANHEGTVADWMIFEGNTQPYTGAGANVVSSKRQSWTTIQLDENTENIGDVGDDAPSLLLDYEQLQAQVAALEEQNAAAESRLAALELQVTELQESEGAEASGAYMPPQVSLVLCGTALAVVGGAVAQVVAGRR